MTVRWTVRTASGPSRSETSVPYIPHPTPIEPVGADIIRPQNVPLSTVGKIVEQGILQMAQHYENVAVDKYCVMPDHVHFILRIESDIGGRILPAPYEENGLPRLFDAQKRLQNGCSYF